MPFEQIEGTLTFLRVHEMGVGWGPPEDHIDCEVIAMVDSAPDKAFGLRLRDDVNRPAHQGMLDLLRDAFNHRHPVIIDYSTDSGKDNGIINWVALSPPSEGRVTQTPSSLNLAEDPAVQGLLLDTKELEDKFPLPPMPASGPSVLGMPGEEEPLRIVEDAEWSHMPMFELRRGQSFESTVEVSERSLVFARALWHGSPRPIEMSLTMGGTTLAAGEALRIPPDQGKISVATEIKAAGRVTVSVVNPTSDSVSVDIVAGVLALDQENYQLRREDDS